MLDEFLHLRDILEACEDIEEFVTGVSMEQFLESKLIRWAVIQRLSVIGEGGAHLSEDLKKKHSEIIWREIIGARNILVHAYFKINWEIIWDTVQNDIPFLRRAVQRIIDEDFSHRFEGRNN